MKKRVVKIALGFVGVLILAFVIANISTYATARKNVFDYSFSKEEKNSVWDMLWKDGEQSVVIDDYTITLDEYLYDEKGQEGYAVFSVRRKGYDMREEYGRDYVPGESENTFGGEIDKVFWGEGRFAFELLVNGSGSIGDKCRYEKEKDVMRVYYEFDVNVDYGFDGEILLCDKENGGEYWKTEEEALYKFKLEKSVEYKMYEINTGENIYHMYVTPLEVKIIGKTSVKQIYDVVLHFEDSKELHIIENERKIWGDEVIDIDKLISVEVNWEKVKQLSNNEVVDVENDYQKKYKEQWNNEENK